MNSLVKLILPVAAFALASAGAVSSNESAKALPETGWQRVSINNCVKPVTCNNIPSTMCTVDGAQVFKKVGLDCIQPLYHTQ